MEIRHNRYVKRASILLALFFLLLNIAAQAAPPWQASLSSAGSVRLQYAGRDVGAMEPGLFEAVWQSAPLSPAKLGAAATQEGLLRGQIRAPGGTIVATEVRAVSVKDGLRLTYRLTPQKDIALNSLHVSLNLPISLVTGGAFVADGERIPIPAQLNQPHLRSMPTRTLDLILADGALLQWRFAAPTPVLLQDDRQWGPTLSVRIGPQMSEKDLWPGGKSLEMEFTLTAKGGVSVEYDRPVTIEAGADWLPLETRLDIVAGSALDFSKLTPWHAPAGKLGRVITDKQGRMAFANRPDEAVRFYGVNLCFSGQYLSHEQADRLAERLLRLGYNAVRIHHYEGMLVDRSQGSSTRLNSQMLDQLDYLAAAFKKRGIYITTDLFVSRPVFANEVWEGAEGDVGMDEFKMAIPINQRAYANYKAFAIALLDHRNPYTGLTWAEDPALAWLSLINEGNPGNFMHLLKGNLRADYTRAWNAYLVKQYPTRAACTRALGNLPEGQDPAQGTVPIPDQNDTTAWVTWNVFLAENQRDFFERTRAFLQKELNCHAQLTNLNAWTNPQQMHTVRTEMDYVDDHYYIDHPEFIEQAWQLPSKCPNTSPVAQGAPGGRGNTFHRLLDRPFTVSEFNYSGPGRYRGVGGILTGALGAVQDWSVIWRFAYSHSRDNLFTPGAAGYFDMATDPLSLASDRASVCLFRRGDMRPATHSVAIAMTPDDVLKSAKQVRAVIPGWTGLALVTRVGTIVSNDPKQANGADILLPLESPEAWGAKALKVNPYKGEAGEQILAEMRKRGWLKKENPTDLKTSRFQSETGELTVDAPADVLTLDTPRTSGGYAPEGKTIKTQAVTVEVQDTGATVWVSSVDGKPISQSSRLLLTHLTDLQNSGARYADKARQVLMDWGGLPHLMRRGRALVTVRMANAAKAKVWSLKTDGARGEMVPTRAQNGILVIPIDINQKGKACMLYEIEVR